MKKLLMFTLLGVTICLLKRKDEKSTWLTQKPKINTTEPPEPLPFNEWCHYVGISRLYSHLK